MQALRGLLFAGLVLAGQIDPAFCQPNSPARVQLLRPTVGGRRPQALDRPSLSATISIATMRAQARTNPQIVTANTSGPSWSAVLQPFDFTATPSPGVVVSWQANTVGQVANGEITFFGGLSGSLTIYAGGLTPNSAYLLSCDFFGLSHSAPPLTLKLSMNNGQTNMLARDQPIAFVAPANGDVTIVMTTQVREGWDWKGCTLGTAY